MPRKFKPEKTFSHPNVFNEGCDEWWATLSDDQKLDLVKQYQILREQNAIKKDFAQWPDMRDLSNIRVSKFSQKDIYCLFRFRFRNHYK